MEDIRYLHIDEAVIAIDKPAGLLSVPGRGPDKADCAIARVQRRHPDARVVHRLDMGTSGVLLFARSLEDQRALGRAFEQRQTDKVYEAVVCGVPATEAGFIDLPLVCDWPNRPRQIVDALVGKPAQTHWRLLASQPDAQRSRLALMPVTGRSHQLRVHLQAIGHPILGDELYAPPDAAAASPRLLLHARCLSLPHPRSGRAFVVESDVPF